jgi:hypothetical protein
VACSRSAIGGNARRVGFLDGLDQQDDRILRIAVACYRNDRRPEPDALVIWL